MNTENTYKIVSSMEVKGETIIITDPCYIEPENSERLPILDTGYRYYIEDASDAKQYFIDRYHRSKLDSKESLIHLMAVYRNKQAEGLISEGECAEELHRLANIINQELKEDAKAYVPDEKKVQEYIAASKKEYDENTKEMKDLGFSEFISSSTIIGDWSCSTVRTTSSLETITQALLAAEFSDNDEDLCISTKVEDYERIGKFCADAGAVAVFKLDEVLKYNPAFDYHTKRKWTTTTIGHFRGTIYCVHGVRFDGVSTACWIIGIGNFNFFSYMG